MSSPTGGTLTREDRRLRGALSMALRCATALVGGYAAAAGSGGLMARLLPVAAVEATTWGIVLSFLIYAGLGLWAFAERRLVVVAGVIWGVGALTFGVTLLMGTRA